MGRITLNRPDSLNAWTEAFGHELGEVVNERAAEAGRARGADHGRRDAASRRAPI